MPTPPDDSDRRIVDPWTQQEIHVPEGRDAMEVFLQFRQERAAADAAAVAATTPSTDVPPPPPGWQNAHRDRRQRVPVYGHLVAMILGLCFGGIFAAIAASGGNGWGALIGIPAGAVVYAIVWLCFVGFRPQRTNRELAATQLSSSTPRAAPNRGSASAVTVAAAAPASRSLRLDDAWAAERFAARWLRSMGVHDANVTRSHKDGGVDVESSRFLVQVKNWKSNVGAPSVQAIHGVAVARGRAAIVLARTGFTREAVTFADEADVALFVYDASAGTVTAASECAHHFLR